MRKHAKKIFATLLAAVMTLTAVPLAGLAGVELPYLKDIFTTKVEAVDSFTEDIYTYTVSNGEATITDCDETASGAITIPSSLGGYPMVKIGSRAFEGCVSLTDITISDDVTQIGSSAFEDCTALTNVTIPPSVINIGNYAFTFCESLENVYYTGSIADWCKISYGNQGGFPMHYAKNLYIDDKLIENNLVIPEGITEIPPGAFSNCSNLNSVFLPSTVTNIGWSAFRNCTGLKKINIPEQITRIANYTFQNCTSLTDIIISEKVKYIGSNAFDGCQELRYSGDIADWCDITFNSSIFSKTENVYINNELVKDKLVIPYGVTKISSYAFSGCKDIVSAEIADTVTDIGDFSFAGCTSLSNIIIPEKITQIGSSAFANTALEKIRIPNSVTNIKEEAFGDCKELSSVVIDDAIASIGDYAFRGCSNLTELKIGDGVTSIGAYAFYGCDKLAGVVVGKGVKKIGVRAFYSCTNLEYVHIPSCVEILEYPFIESMFDVCTDSEEWALKQYGGESITICTGNHEPIESHEHSYKTFSYNQVAHPHYAVYKCECGEENITTETVVLNSCDICNPPHICYYNIFAYSQSEHPHYVAYKCSCGVVQISNETSKFDLCEICNPTSPNPEETTKPSTSVIPVDKVMLKVPSQTEINYGDSIVLHVDVDLPVGAKVVWKPSNENFSCEISADGKTCKITPDKSGDTTFTAYVVDENGKPISEEYTQTMTSKAGIFQKIIAFFKKLFGLTKVIPDTVKFAL